jgi:superfamily II RNA helicase
MDPEEYEELKPVVQRYRKGAYEPVRSSFNLSFNSIVHLIQRHGLEAVRRIVDRSFLAWHLTQQAREQFARAEKLEQGHGEKGASRQELKEAQKLRTRAENAGSQTWDQFLERRTFLQSIGYLAQDDTFNAGARVLQHIQIAEIFMTELVLSGELEMLDADTLFGVLCGVCGDLPRGAQPNFSPTRHDRELVAKLQKVRFSAPVTGSEALLGQPVTWSPEMVVLGRCWAEGTSLTEILLMVRSPTDISGTLVSCFRRAKDLVGQLKAVYAQIPEIATTMHELIKKVSRDEVEVVD